MSRTEFELSSLDQSQIYKLLVSALQPRPIAWVSTVSAAGIANLAPFSFATVASRNPATVMVSIGAGPDGRVKDTLANARETGCFVLNTPSVGDRADVTVSGTDTGSNEFDLTLVSAIAGTAVAAPRVAEAGLSLECRVAGEKAIGTDTVIFGEVLWAHAAPGVFDDAFHVDNGVLSPLGRLAGPWYTGPLTAVAQNSDLSPVVGTGGGR